VNPPKKLPTTNLLGLIGSPFANEPADGEVGNPLSTYDFAAKNRIRLLGLNAILQRERSSSLEQKRTELMERYSKTLGVFSDVSDLLDDSGINHAFFKSFRPYKEATVDLDVLVFGDDHQDSVHTMVNGGYTLLEEGPLSTTVQDESIPLNVDLYNEIGVSRLVYLDKEKLRPFVAVRKLEDGASIRSLDAKADLLALIAHSMIKEHMYVLSEYFTTLGFLKSMSGTELDAFINLASDCYVQYSTSVHLNITCLLHRLTHESVPEGLHKVMEALGPGTSETARLIQRDLEMPYKYSTSTIIRCFAEKLEEPKSRRSVISQLKGIFDPSFSRSFLKAALEHLTRETY
jgi:hypothetical protein